MLQCHIKKRRLVGSEALLEVRFGGKESSFSSPEAERSDVVGANVLKVVELQL